LGWGQELNGEIAVHDDVGSAEPKLTWEIFAEIWQLAVTDRKRLAEKVDLLDKAGLRDDKVFYSAMLERMRTDPSFCRALFAAFQAFPKPKDQRSFSHRAWRWMDERIKGLLWDKDSKTIQPDLATWPELEREVFQLWAAPMLTADTPEVQAEPESADCQDWLALVARMQQVLSAMDHPDPGRARALVVLAEHLMVACETAAAEDERAADLDQRRSAIGLAISHLDLGEDLSGLDDAALHEVEAKVAEVEARTAQAAAAQERLTQAETREEAIRSTPATTVAERRERDRRSGEALDRTEVCAGEAAAAEGDLARATQELAALLHGLCGQTEPEAIDPVPEEPEPLAPAAPEPEAQPALVEPDRHFPPTVEQASRISEPAEAQAAFSPGILLPEPQTATDPQPEPEAQAASWTGRLPIDEVMTQLLDRGDLALAWHLSDLAEANGLTPPVPSGLLKSLVASEVLTGPYDAAAQTLGEWLAAAMAEVEAAEARGAAAGLRARSVALAALLRPALMARDTNARDHLGALSLADGLQGFASVVAPLRDLRRDLQPSLADLADLAGVEKQRRLPGALSAIQEWLPGARRAQTMHAPTGLILHKLLDPHGDLGRLFEAAQVGGIAEVEEAFGWLLPLATDKKAAEDKVVAAEKEIGRPKRDAIKGMALDWIVRKLREAAELLLDWRAAWLDEQDGDMSQKARLAPSVNELKKVVAKALREAGTEVGVDAAVQRLLDRAMADFLAVVEGRAAQVVVRPSEVLEAALLRLPGPCQPYAPEGAAFFEERQAQRLALFRALQQPDDFERDEVRALAFHLGQNAILPVEMLLDRLERQRRLTAAEVQGFRNDLDNARYTAREAARLEITGLRHDLEPLQSIDLATSQEIQIWLDRLGMIDAALQCDGEFALPMKENQRSPVIPPDFPHLARALSEAGHLRDRVRKGIRATQRQTLERLTRSLHERGNLQLSAEAAHVAETLEDRDPIAVEDILIRLQNGQSFALTGEAQEDHFAAFYPGFVAALTSDIETMAIQAAMKAGGQAGPLNYRGLEEHEVKRAVELDENWRAVRNSFDRSRDIGPALRSFMERLGFTSVVIERETQLSAQLRWMWMKSDRLAARDWFLPPAFGSEANGSYPVFLAHRHVEDAQLVAEMAKIGRNSPCVLLVFGRLSKARRESFGLAMRKAKQTVLLIDEAQVLYLTTGGNWLQRLFACATPFGYLQPYTTSAGNIPVEMFFGRESEIAQIESTTADGCLVYGGRQLGKSALLHHVRKRSHQPLTGRHAYYLKIDEFGGPVQPASQIWSAIRRVLLDDEVLPKTAENLDDIRAAIKAWLNKSGERRILLLVDEADLFLSSEARSGFPNLNPLKDLMEETQRRFKVVFAGLHNVQRMAKAPNSPLVHLSKPICIGPLNTSPESSQQARRLVVEPMRAAGFDYERPELVHSLLTRVNFYPSLIQVFLKALLEGLSNQSRPQGPGPRWVLKEEQLFRGPSSEGINAQIRERFQWTLNLDPRYELIAKVLGRHRILSADADGGAMAADEVQREAEIWWPAGQEKLSRADFPAFLDEMVDLGVLIRLPGPRGLYGLRGAQVAQMLGQLAQLDEEILQIAEKEPRVDYDPSHYHRRVGPDPHIDRRSPLPDRSMASLFDTEAPGLRLVIAAPAVLGGDQAQILADLAEGWHDGKGRLSGEVFRGQEADLRRLVDRVQGRKVLVLQAQSVKPDWLTWLVAQSSVREGRLLPVIVGGPDVAARVWPRGIPAEIRVFRAKPWERTMLRAWLADSGLPLLDTPEVREALLEISGGASAILGQLRPRLDPLIAEGRREGLAARLRDLGASVTLSANQVGLPDRLVPLFCNAAELLQGDELQDQEELINLLAAESPDARQEIARMADLGLFQVPEPSAIALAPLGALLYRVCNEPRRS